MESGRSSREKLKELKGRLVQSMVDRLGQQPMPAQRDLGTHIIAAIGHVIPYGVSM
jgi:hypothetical protein